MQTSFRAWLGLVSQRWATLRGIAIGGPLIVLTAVISVLSYIKGWGSAPGVALTGVTAIWYAVTLPIAMYQVWRGEHTKVIEMAHGSHSKFAPDIMEYFKVGHNLKAAFRGASTDAEVDALVPQMDKWYADAQNWLKANMGDAALAAFLDNSGHRSFSVTGAAQISQTQRNSRNNALNVLDFAMPNLQSIANTRMYDP